MQVLLWEGAAACAAIAAAGALAERRRRHRRDPDAVGLVPWVGVQATALFAAVILAALAVSG